MMGLFSRVFTLISFITFTSCTNWSSTLSKVKIQKEIDLSHKVDDALASLEFQKGYWPEEEWWSIFEDTQLSSFIKTALDMSPSLKTTEARVRQANQEAFVARSKLLPSLGGVFNYLYSYLGRKGLPSSFQQIDPKLDLFFLLLDFSYEFDFWKKNSSIYEAALGKMRTQEALDKQATIILSISIAKQYYDLQANLSKMAILQEMLENKSKLFRLTELRRINRIDNMVDLNSIKQEIFSLQETIAALDGEIKLQKSLLVTLMGQNPDEEIKVIPQWNLPQHPFEIPENIGLGLLVRRPDLMAQVWSVYTATKNIGSNIAKFFPDINLVGFGGTDAMKFEDLFSKNSGTITALPVITQPIFMGGRLTSSLKASLAAYEVAVYTYNETLLNAANEVVSSFVKVKTSKEKLDYQTSEVMSKKDNYELVYSRYKHGIDSMLKVLKMDDQYLQARFEQIQLTCDRVQSTIDLVKALGGGYHYQKAKEQKEINQL